MVHYRLFCDINIQELITSDRYFLLHSSISSKILEVQNTNPSFVETNSEEFKVLFIDDAPELRMVLSEVLTAEGYQVQVASTAGEALDTLERFYYLYCYEVESIGRK